MICTSDYFYFALNLSMGGRVVKSPKLVVKTYVGVFIAYLAIDKQECEILERSAR